MLIYALTKYAAYTAWCWLGLYLLTARGAILPALGYGALRWLLGLVFGVFAALGLGSIDAASVAMLYVAVYVPLRIVEWALIVVLMSRGSGVVRSAGWYAKALFWIVGGIAVSFATDLTSPEGLAGKFCVGRCLC